MCYVCSVEQYAIYELHSKNIKGVVEMENCLEKSKENFVEVITGCFAKESYATAITKSGNLEVHICWNIQDGEERPNKISKRLVIVVSQEALETFCGKDNSRQERAIFILKDHLTKRLLEFNPNHNNPKHQIPPEEKWTITESLLFP